MRYLDREAEGRREDPTHFRSRHRRTTTIRVADIGEAVPERVTDAVVVPVIQTLRE